MSTSIWISGRKKNRRRYNWDRALESLACLHPLKNIKTYSPAAAARCMREAGHIRCTPRSENRACPHQKGPRSYTFFLSRCDSGSFSDSWILEHFLDEELMNWPNCPVSQFFRFWGTLNFHMISGQLGTSPHACSIGKLRWWPHGRLKKKKTKREWKTRNTVNNSLLETNDRLISFPIMLLDSIHAQRPQVKLRWILFCTAL